SGERRLIWSALHGEANDPAHQALIIRPATSLMAGHRYIVGLRNLRASTGDRIAPSDLFRADGDGIDTGLESLEARRATMNALFETLELNGVARDNLVQAWTFTVASQRNITERLLHIRDQAFAALGGGAPVFSI